MSCALFCHRKSGALQVAETVSKMPQVEAERPYLLLDFQCCSQYPDLLAVVCQLTYLEFNGAFQSKRNAVALRDQNLRWHQGWNEPQSDKYHSQGVVAVLQAVRGSKYSHVARSIPVSVVSSEAIYILLIFVFRHLLVQRRISCVGSRSSLRIWLCSYHCCGQGCG